MKPVTDQLAASIFNGPSMTTLEELADGIGGRLTGSPAYVRATEWAAAKFRTMESKMCGWSPSRSQPAGSGAPRPDHSLAAVASAEPGIDGLGPVPPAGGIQGPVVLVADVEPDVFAIQEK